MVLSKVGAAESLSICNLVVLYMLFFIFLAMACGTGCNAISDKDAKFYIFDWPAELQSSWPEPGVTLIPHPGRTARPLGYKHEEGTHFGAGSVLNASYGLYASNYFHLYQLIMSRLRVHPKRTLNRSDAMLFVAPVDVGVMAQWNKENGQYRMHQAYGGSKEWEQVCAHLRTDIANTPLYGHDVLLINSLFNIFNSNISKIFFECANCTVINHDTNRAYDNYQYKYAKSNKISLASAQFGVPYMSAVHWHEDITDIPWRTGQYRPVPVAFWAALTVQHKGASQLRRKLSEDCTNRIEQCVAVQVSDRHAQPCYSKSAGNCLKDPASNVGSLPGFGAVGLDLYRLSQYCLQPPGDMDGRKALSDSIMLGCIPVYFHAHLLSEKYSWFFSVNEEREAALYIPWQVVMGNASFNLVDYIASIPVEVTTKKQEAVAKIAYRMTYSVPPKRFDEYIGFGGAPGVKVGAKWAPPFEDATDIILERTFKRIER